MEDDEIRAALGRGDTDGAFRTLVRAHGPAIFTRCCHILKDRTAAEDIMQQALMAAFKHHRKLLEVEQIRGWLIQIAVRKCFDALRSLKRNVRLQRDVMAGEAPEIASLLDALGTSQERRALEECLHALDPELATAVLMRYRDGMSWAQIADAVAMPLDTIRMRVTRGALESLRECLEAKEVVR
ncbi:MAG TPA: RNA polymerase sigma factor [Kofleriaceae bacterium]|nr:RNA polymerase sigma factor [Kofleriaceae bacterium]